MPSLHCRMHKALTQCHHKLPGPHKLPQSAHSTTPSRSWLGFMSCAKTRAPIPCGTPRIHVLKAIITRFDLGVASSQRREAI